MNIYKKSGEFEPLTDEYLHKNYGDPLVSLATAANPFKSTTICSEYNYGEPSNANEKDVQCDMLTLDGGHSIDPSRLTYEQRLRWHFKEFCYKTSSHGIPMIGQAPNKYYRTIWIVLVASCLLMFLNQAANVIEKFSRKDKITDIQLRFENAPFPAITVCNLNPYKRTLLRNVPKARRVLDVFNDVMKDANVHKTNLRAKRSDSTFFEPVNAFCKCLMNEEENILDCAVVADQKLPPNDTDVCTCGFDRHTNDPYPCSRKDDWFQDWCRTCQSGSCMRPDVEQPGIALPKVPCYCMNLFPFCLVHDGLSPILNLWEYTPENKTDVTFEEDAQFLEALGFEGMVDEVAIVNKAKENIMYAMAEFSDPERIALSNGKHELIQKCSFNGKACDIENDFLAIVDPSFGSCYIFNHDRHLNRTSIRAGPMYGLRMLVYVNGSEYLPTTEAVGARVVIHDKDQYPFPDTFGYSAPTGYVSSFGMKLKRMWRMSAPYGDCTKGLPTTSYLYKNYSYSVEGCYRSCFQETAIEECGCADPRFPSVNGTGHCGVADHDSRRCVKTKTDGAGSGGRCKCKQSCRQSVYSVSYSAAIWPSQSLEITLGDCRGSPAQCNLHYMEHAAMIEVFYEMLNFEEFKESEAYGFVKLISDFGGQLGLWSGISFITCFEFVCLLIETLYMVGSHHYQKRKAANILKQFQRDKFY